MKPKPKSKSKSKSLALTVFDEHAMPLNFVDPRSACSPSLAELTSGSEIAGKHGLREMQVHRRSPRLSPLPDLPSPPRKKARGSSGNAGFDKSVRRSARLSSADTTSLQKDPFGTELVVRDKVFTKEALVEVSSDEEGFRGSWFAATIVKPVRKDKFLIEYKCLRTEDDSAFLREEVDNNHIRPHPPENVVDHFTKLDEVDALYNGGWWVGVILKVLRSSRYVVYFNETGEELEYQHSELRLHQDWIDDKWVIPSRDPWVIQHKNCKGGGSMVSNAIEEKNTMKLTRRSPRLMNQSEIKCCYPEVSTLEVSLRNLDSSQKGFSRAMSLRAADAERPPRCLKHEQLSDLKECPSIEILIHKLNENHIRRSPRFSPIVAAANSNTSSSIELSGSKGKGPCKKIMVSLGESDLEVLDVKCLRKCPGRAASMFAAKRRETECALIELPETETRETEHAFIDLPETCVNQSPKNVKIFISSQNRKKNSKTSFFIGDPIPDVEAQERWGWRYQLKGQRSNNQSMKLNDSEEDEMILNVECHFTQAKISNCIFSLGDCVYIQGNEGKKEVGRILEFFKTTDGENYFRVQWFYRVEDTVIKDVGRFHDKRRLFYSTIMNDNLIDCIISKVNVTQISPGVGLKLKSIKSSDFYYDMEYCIDYSTFRNMVTGKMRSDFDIGRISELDNSLRSNSFSSSNLTEKVHTLQVANYLGNSPSCDTYNAEFSLLDLYCGCGGMSTGLCLGAKLSSVNLVTKWALDSDKSACESLKLNHPETHVRNEAAEDFLELLKEWEKLCRQYEVDNAERSNRSRAETPRVPNHDDENTTGEFEVSRIIDICYGDPNKTGKRGVNFKVRWKGYGSNDDTWEPIGGLSNCKESIHDFVRNGRNMKILPLPGDADVICGGPPCQGISGYNRFRKVDSPLDDEKNRQIIVFMDIVNQLKPKYVLMENVADILRLDKASLGRYALSRLVQMTYQARLGIIAAGCYGLPQFRLRVFLWGAHPSEKLPQFPRPTHEVIIRYWPPPEFERNVVAYDEDQPRELEKALLLQDAISDLPAVKHNETSDEMSFSNPPKTDFQRYIRSTQYEMIGSALDNTEKTTNLLYDHRSYPLHEDDYVRVCQIPKRKGANFRDLPGVVVGRDNVARRDLTEKQSVLPSGKPLVPDYAFTFEQGKSKRPFARLWWDETVATVLTFPSCHNQVVLHPEQDRILTVRECARLQGFPDYYRFCGTVRERYCQVGNAVAIPVARALGYALGLAVHKSSGNEPLLTLPQKFSHSNYFQFTQIMPLP